MVVVAGLVLIIVVVAVVIKRWGGGTGGGSDAAAARGCSLSPSLRNLFGDTVVGKEWDSPNREQTRALRILEKLSEVRCDIETLFPDLSSVLARLEDPLMRVGVLLAYRNRLRPESDWFRVCNEAQWTAVMDTIECCVFVEGRPARPASKIFLLQMENRALERVLASL